MHQSNAKLSHEYYWEKPAANDECASGKLFPGQYYDSETSLHYNYFRTYDPGSGRYNESDPIGLWGGYNTYVYVVNNPLYYFDLYGLVKGANTAGPGGYAGPGIRGSTPNLSNTRVTPGPSNTSLHESLENLPMYPTPGCDQFQDCYYQLRCVRYRCKKGSLPSNNSCGPDFGQFYNSPFNTGESCVCKKREYVNP